MRKLTKKEINTILEYRNLKGLTFENIRFIEKMIHDKNKPSRIKTKGNDKNGNY